MRALISVSDKTGVVKFAKELEKLGIEIISTGGTYKKLKEEGIKVTGVSDITSFPECLDGRVKTLHPKIHGGLLARRDVKDHMEQLKKLEIEPIDIVAINLYPFKETILKKDVTLEDAIENIDIGGPTMLRSSAKNHKDVTVICDPKDYEKVVAALKEGGTSYDMRYRLALKVFQQTAAYDGMIAEYLRKEIDGDIPENLTLTYEKVQDLRYGENPHQAASYYKEIKPEEGSLASAKQLHGKELSFNNINDASATLDLLKEFEEPAVIAVKHANPCGVAVGSNVFEAYKKAHDCDPVSIFGGIVGCNREVDKVSAEEMNKIFLEIIIAPSFSNEALDILQKKKNIRLLEIPNILKKPSSQDFDIKKVSGGLLVQSLDDEMFNIKKATMPDQPATDSTKDNSKKEGNLSNTSQAGKIIHDNQLMVVTEKEPTKEQIEDMEIAMKVVKHTKSNGIVFVKDKQTIAIAPGQTNRIWAVENGIKRCLFNLKGAVMASDAFFPFDDCVTVAAEAGIGAIIQPGGSIRDKDSIDKANALGITMVFSGQRHFKH